MGGYMECELFRDNICEYALTFLDKEYNNNEFVWYVFHLLFNIDINNCKDISSIDSFDVIPKGSVLFFSKENNSHYMGIFLGDNEFIHANLDKRIIVSYLDEYWKNLFVGYIDILKKH